MTITHNEISQRAREIWEREGRPEGRDKEHWLQAETELRQAAPSDQTSHRLAATDPALFKVSDPESKENGLRKRSGRRSR